MASRRSVAFEKLHGHVEDPVLLAVVVDGDDVRVVQERRGLGLALEPLQGLVVRGRRRTRDGLQGHLAVEDRVEGLEDLAHRSPAELAENLVLADPLAVHGASDPNMPRGREGRSHGRGRKCPGREDVSTARGAQAGGPRGGARLDSGAHGEPGEVRAAGRGRASSCS